jgi:hypothetical protein
VAIEIVLNKIEMKVMKALKSVEGEPEEFLTAAQIRNYSNNRSLSSVEIGRALESLVEKKAVYWDYKGRNMVKKYATRLEAKYLEKDEALFPNASDSDRLELLLERAGTSYEKAYMEFTRAMEDVGKMLEKGDKDIAEAKKMLKDNLQSFQQK